MSKESDDKYSDKEAEERLVKALRGARIAGHKPLKDKPAVKKKKLKVKS